MKLLWTSSLDAALGSTYQIDRGRDNPGKDTPIVTPISAVARDGGRRHDAAFLTPVPQRR
jgi:hypothetical protein